MTDNTHTQMHSQIYDRWNASALPTLHEYIRIPNKSPVFDESWEANGYMDQAARMLCDWAQTADIEGMQLEVFKLPGRTPIIFAEIPDSNGVNNPTDPTVLLYGHYDKQPEFAGWREDLDPWVPHEEDGKLYGRGGADDGYAIFASLLSIEAMRQHGRPHPRCVMLIEGCEESGSFDLPAYVEAKKDRIGQAELVICLDAECGDYDRLWVTTSLRGMLPGVLRVKMMNEGQHSGAAGGVVPSTFRILRHLMERVEKAADGSLHEVLHAEIPEQAQEDANKMAQVLGTAFTDKYPWVEGAGPGDLDPSEHMLANAWKPSMETVGISGAPEVENAGNTLRPETVVKLVFRLPPTLEAEPAAAQIKEILETDPPYGAEVTFDLEHPQTGWRAPTEAPWLTRALQGASSRFFGREVMYMGTGGTIPFMNMLGDAYPNTQFFVTGVLGPNSNAHGPNEFLHIETARRLTCCVTHVLEAAWSEFAQR